MDKHSLEWKYISKLPVWPAPNTCTVTSRNLLLRRVYPKQPNKNAFELSGQRAFNNQLFCYYNCSEINQNLTLGFNSETVKYFSVINESCGIFNKNLTSETLICLRSPTTCNSLFLYWVGVTFLKPVSAPPFSTLYRKYFRI